MRREDEELEVDLGGTSTGEVGLGMRVAEDRSPKEWAWTGLDRGLGTSTDASVQPASYKPDEGVWPYGRPKVLSVSASTHGVVPVQIP